jgi:ankyrin repeat protein
MKIAALTSGVRLPILALLILLAPSAGECGPIHEAVRQGDVAGVNRIIESDRSALNARDENGYTPLYTAATYNKLPTVRLLVKEGADPRIANNWGDEPIHQAAYFGTVEMVSLLLERGIDVNQRGSSQRTPLHQAASTGKKKDTIELLLQRGADINAVDENGWTPLHDAARVKLDIGFRPAPQEVVELLIRRGAAINAMDRQGRTPLGIARAWGNGESAAVLLAHGAQ